MSMYSCMQCTRGMLSPIKHKGAADIVLQSTINIAVHTGGCSTL